MIKLYGKEVQIRQEGKSDDSQYHVTGLVTRYFVDDEDISQKPVGYLINGLFACDNCEYWLVYNLGREKLNPVPVFIGNILPYSQVCWICKALVIDAARKAADDSPLSAYMWEYEHLGKYVKIT
jgi:hypothetical protein